MGSSLSASPRDPGLKALIKERYKSLDDLSTASEAVEALLASPGWVTLTALLDDEAATVDRELDGKRLLDSKAEYASRLGYRRGLRTAPALIETLISHADDRLREQRLRHEGAAEPALSRG